MGDKGESHPLRQACKLFVNPEPGSITQAQSLQISMKTCNESCAIFSFHVRNVGKDKTSFLEVTPSTLLTLSWLLATELPPPSA